MTINLANLRGIMPFAGIRVDRFVEPLNEAAREFNIDRDVRRLSAWLAQIAHESGELRYVREIASGVAYEYRKDLGNVEPGDGLKYKGRGLLQITGRANYAEAGKALGMDLIAHPEQLEQPITAARSAGWFWASRGLNELADDDKFGAITKRINGGYSALDARLAYWLRARRVLGVR